MSEDRSLRNGAAATLLLVAFLIATNNIVSRSSLEDFGFALILLLIGLFILFVRMPRVTAKDTQAFEPVEPDGVLIVRAAPALATGTGTAVTYSTPVAAVPPTKAPIEEPPTKIPPVEEPPKKMPGVEEPPTKLPPTQEPPPSPTETPSPVKEPTEPSAVERPSGEPRPDQPPPPAEPSPDSPAADMPPAERVIRESPVGDPMAAPKTPDADEKELQEGIEKAKGGKGDGDKDESDTVELQTPTVAKLADEETKEVVVPDVTPKLVEVTPESTTYTPDDLTKIHGIGPKIAAALRDLGIDTFEKLAYADETQLQRALENVGAKRLGDPGFWIQQAAYAEKGDWDSVQRLINERRAGGDD